jgi:hypothetical protein
MFVDHAVGKRTEQRLADTVDIDEHASRWVGPTKMKLILVQKGH